jgi:hypothetical protein
MSERNVVIRKLRAELVLDMKRLSELATKNRKAVERVASGPAEELDYAALGYTIHNIFNLIENYTTRIAKVFENQIDPGTWHRDLIHRMQLDIEGVRPALWDGDLAGKVDELRRFRHAFRNMYAQDLDPRRVALVQENVPETVRDFGLAHDRFLDMIDVMISAAEEPPRSG